MDLDLRGSRLEREAEQRRKIAKKKRDEEELAKACQLERERELAEVEATRKVQAEARLAESELLERAEALLTGGIRWQEPSLRPYLLESAEDDRIILPESSLAALTQLDAFSKGIFMFKISAESNGTTDTHCGVREFSAPAGSVGLPIKVAESLLRAHEPSLSTEDLHLRLGKICVKYVRLPKARFARLQPLKNLFNSVSAVKEVLESNLRYHTTLSDGDIVTVWHRGTAHVLRVVSISESSQSDVAAAGRDDEEDGDGDGGDFAAATKARGFSLVDTDVEIEIDVSLEYQQSQAQEPQAKASSIPAATTVFASTTTHTDRPTASEVEAGVSAPPPLDKETLRQRRIEAMAKRGSA